MIETLFVRLARAGARAFPPPPPRGSSQRLTQACHLPPWAVPAVAVAACNGGLLAPGPCRASRMWVSLACRALVGNPKNQWKRRRKEGSGAQVLVGAREADRLVAHML